MSINFELILFTIIIICGFCFAISKIYPKILKNQRNSIDDNFLLKRIIDYVAGFFIPLLIIFIIRSFIVEPYRIPSGSDEPTLLVGDFIVAKKYSYGVRLPLTNKKIIKINEPNIGDMVLFKYPENPDLNFIKRVVGAPNSDIAYKNKVLFINGKEQKQTKLGVAIDYANKFKIPRMVYVYNENLNGFNHKIYIDPNILAENFKIHVPFKNYFVMGDNRDNSNDSRYWGFVPEENLIGKAWFIWLSWSGGAHPIRFARMFTKIH